MDKWLNQDIVFYIHKKITDRLIMEYSDTICLTCLFNGNPNSEYYLPISTIERANIKYSDGSNRTCIKEPVEMAIMTESTSWLGPPLRGAGPVALEYTMLHREENERDPIYNFEDEQVADLPDNYWYTYEKDGWLKKVVDNS